MAEMLLNLRTNNPSGYGNILHIEEDDFQWGSKEISPNYGLLKFPDVPASGLLKYGDLRPAPPSGIPDQVQAFGRRKWSIDVSGLSVPLKALIDGGGPPSGQIGSLIVDIGAGADVNWNSFRARIRDRQNGTDEQSNGTPAPAKNP